MKTLTRTDRFVVPAPPETVFPLMCPVREYDWIPHWECDLLHSESGVAEEDCVFRTDFPDLGPMTWVVTRYEPGSRIEFCCFAPDLVAMRLKIGMEAEDDGSTRIEWTRRWLSLGPRGDAWIDAWSEPAYREKMTGMLDMLTHYLKTGEMLTQ